MWSASKFRIAAYTFIVSAIQIPGTLEPVGATCAGGGGTLKHGSFRTRRHSPYNAVLNCHSHQFKRTAGHSSADLPAYVRRRLKTQTGQRVRLDANARISPSPKP